MRFFNPFPQCPKAITLFLGLIALSGCGEDVLEPPIVPVTQDTGPPTATGTPVTNTGLPPCDPPLSLTPDSGVIPPYQLLQFVGAGGSGEYRFSLITPANGDIHPTTGTYGAPGEVGLVDEVVMTDPSCEGESTAEVLVVDGLSIRPASAEILPSTEFAFEVEGGIGSFTCNMLSADSGGTVDASCNYAAGTTNGVDTIEVIDDAGYSALANIVINDAATLAPEGYAHWFIPVGSSFSPAAEGGSGVLDLTVLTGTVGTSGSQLDATQTGQSTVRVTDRFAGFTYDVTVDVVSPMGPDYDWVGPRTNDTRTLALGDVNGDSYDDFAIGIQDHNGARYDGGIVQVFAGGPGGPSATPVQVIAGEQREQDLGSALTMGDVDLDGQIDLLVGTDKDDLLETDIGSVRIYRGISGGFFETEPTWILPGTRSFDRAGGSVGVCDLNGDSWPEVISGASGAEDRTLIDFPSGSGALLVYEGSSTGYVTDPVIIRYGVRVDATGTAWELAEDLELGERDLTVGDVNNDGLCDVIASVVDKSFNDSTDGPGEGYVLVWHGMSSGFLSPEPVRAYANLIDDSADFGRRLAVADFDGDGQDDVVVGAHTFDAINGSAGGLFVYLSTEDDGRIPTDPYTESQANWYANGASGSDNLGRGLSVGDYDGDGIPDLVGGAYLEDEFDSNAGQVRVWSGADIAASPIDDQYTNAIVVWDGDENDGRLGESVAIVGDTDGDGLTDLAAIASESDFYGLDVGRPYHWSNGVGTGLDLEGEPAGDKSGNSVGWLEATGDGIMDVVAGAPQTYHSIEGTLAGSLDIFTGDATGSFGAQFGVNEPSELTSYDRFAEYLSTESDFNGDGYKDLAVGTRGMPTPGTYDASYDNPEGCIEDLGDNGSVSIYLGGPTGLTVDASFLWFTTDPHSNIEALAGGFDFNGDGYQDIVVGDEDWSIGGGFTVIYGQAWSGNTTILCGDPPVLSLEDGGNLGKGVSGIGDLNADGCDELAVSGDEEHGTGSDRGVLHILWGFGGPGCPNTSERTSLQGLIDNADIGEVLDGGLDVDGDTIPDLVISSTNVDVGGTNAGGVWLVSGAYILSLPTETSGVNNWPDPSEVTFHDLPELGIDSMLVGTQSAVEFGESVALLQDPLDPNRAALAVGLPLGSVGGTSLSGGVRIHRWDTNTAAWESEPYAVVGGESHLPTGELGGILSGLSPSEGSAVLVGAFWSHQIGPDRGATYAIFLD